MKRRADLIVVFKKLKSILKEYESQLTVRADFDSRYELWSEKDVIIGGKKRKEVFFTIKKVDAILLRQIKSALKKGFSEYKKNRWI